METQDKNKANLFKVLTGFIVIISVLIVVQSFSNFRHGGMWDGGVKNTITFSGYGEVQAVPDIANVSFSIQKEKKTIKEAQDEVALIEKKALDFLKENNIELKDIKTTNASFYPKYEYKYEKVTCIDYYCPPAGRNVVTGYVASESITVKIRNTDDAGKILQGLGGFGVTDLNGPNFSIDNQKDLESQARQIAITEAKEKAKTLAKDLGVKLGKISSFSEYSNNPEPYYYGRDEVSVMASSKMAPAELPVGENTISSNVSITYEIR